MTISDPKKMSSPVKEHPILFNAEMVRKILSGAKSQTRRFIKQSASTSANNLSQEDCPFGKAGDILWVRETFRRYDRLKECACYEQCHCPQVPHYLYRASDNDEGVTWKPSIHMPRHAARILLRITSIRLEHLNSISEADARAEGCDEHADPVAAFQQLWCNVYGVQNWKENPMVWVVDFEPVTL